MMKQVCKNFALEDLFRRRLSIVLILSFLFGCSPGVFGPPVVRDKLVDSETEYFSISVPEGWQMKVSERGEGATAADPGRWESVLAAGSDTMTFSYSDPQYSSYNIAVTVMRMDDEDAHLRMKASPETMFFDAIIKANKISLEKWGYGQIHSVTSQGNLGVYPVSQVVTEGKKASDEVKITTIHLYNEKRGYDISYYWFKEFDEASYQNIERAVQSFQPKW